MSTQEIVQQEWNSLLQGNYGTPIIELHHGIGAEVWDINNKRYLDLLGGIATNILGHAHPVIIEAVTEQIAQLSHVSNFYSHPQVLKLAVNLQEMVGDESARTFFCNSGAEANEAALKLSRLTGRRNIVATEGAFHGRTMGALSLTGQPAKREPFAPLLKKVKFVPFGNIAAMQKAITKKTAMFIVEPIQGENGVVVPPAGYLKAARERTLETGTMLVIDAVQTGMGRTGAWFGYESEGITPDVITLAKGIGGGLPLGAMIAIGKYAHLFTAGSHGTTFGGNPVACAAANATIEFLKSQEILKENRVKGEHLKAEISQIPGVQLVRGEGLLIGIVLSTPIAKSIASQLLSDGFLVNAANESVIRLAPPLVITNPQLDEFIAAFRKVMTSHV
jgi:acetylornithine aminotransferase